MTAKRSRNRPDDGFMGFYLLLAGIPLGISLLYLTALMIALEVWEATHG